MMARVGREEQQRTRVTDLGQLRVCTMVVFRLARKKVRSWLKLYPPLALAVQLTS